MLKRRNFKLASRCSICFEEKESVDHLFVHCRMDSTLWYLSLSLMGFSWVQPKTTRDVLMAWSRRLKKCWVLQVWCVWLFGGVLGRREIAGFFSMSFQDFKLHFLRTLYNSSQVLNHSTNSTFLDFADRNVVESLMASCYLWLLTFVTGWHPLGVF